MQSPEIAREMGAVLLSKFHHLRVNVTNPDIVVMVEIREKYAYIHGKQLPGAGGMPIGTSGRGLLLLSGGIDSPVAGYMLAKRGVEICALHFQSPPYTGKEHGSKFRPLPRSSATIAESLIFSPPDLPKSSKKSKINVPRNFSQLSCAAL